jgi:hypothetical protein
MKARSTALVSLVSGALILGTATVSSAASSSVAANAVAPHSSSATTAAKQIHASLITSSTKLAACYPHARARVTVDLTTNTIGKDTFTINASGLKPNTDFTVFLLEKAGAPFGAAEYLGDFHTNGGGSSVNSFQAIVEEAFAFNNATGARTDLNSVGFWFADPKDDDACLGKASPITGFDGDGKAGVQMMNSGIAVLP